ncbi:MAG: hypothetical protein R3F14_04565 [Polyangiaceae bacterium]
MGQSTCIGIGGDPVGRLDFIDCLEMFNNDADTHGVVIIGEIGGSAEQRAAAWIKANMKPVAAFIAGRAAPPGKRMGHAGRDHRGRQGDSGEIARFEEAGVRVAPTPRRWASRFKPRCAAEAAVRRGRAPSPLARVNRARPPRRDPESWVSLSGWELRASRTDPCVEPRCAAEAGCRAWLSWPAAMRGGGKRLPRAAWLASHKRPFPGSIPLAPMLLS